MKFKKVEIQAFRAYQKLSDATFDFEIIKSDEKEIANFISLYAPNGFGKTSFYDAVEYGITNSIDRFLKSKINKDIAKNERALINTKGGQKILRNRYVKDDSIPSEIRLYTTGSSHPIVRTVPKNKKRNSTDFHFDKSKIENKYFQTVILSQEWIDSFLREDNPSERYEKFMDYFGDSGIGDYYKDIVSLIAINDKKIKELSGKLAGVQKELDFDGDKNTLKKINGKIKELNKFEEKIDLIDESYTESDSLKLSNTISENLNNLQYQKIKKIELIRFIDEVFSGNDDIKGIEVYFNSKTKLNELKMAEKKNSTSIKNFETINKLVTEQSKLSKLQRELIKEKDQLKNTEKLFPQYKKTFVEIKQIEKTIDDEVKRKDTFEKEVKELNISESEKQIKLNHLKKEAELLQEQFDETKELNKKIESEGEKLNSLRSSIEDGLAKKKLSEQVKLEKELEIENFNTILKEIENERYPSIFDKEFFLFKEILTTIEENQSQLKQKKETLSKLNLKIKNQEVLNKDIELFISKGAELIDKAQNSTCPLCDYEYKSLKELSERVANNKFISQALSILLKDRAAIENEIKVVTENLKADKKTLIKSFNQELAKRTKFLFKINEIILNWNKEIQILELEQNQITAYFKKAKNLLKGKTYQDYEKIFFASKEKLNREQKVLSESIKKLKEKLNLTISEISILEKKKQLLEKNIQELKQNTAFVKVSDYFETSLTDGTTLDVIEKDVNKFKERIRSNNLRFISIEEEVSDLNKTLKGTTLKQLIEHQKLVLKSKELLQNLLISFQREVSTKLDILVGGFDKKSLTKQLDKIKEIAKNKVNKAEELIKLYTLLVELKKNVEPFLKFEHAKKTESKIKEKKEVLEKKVKMSLEEEKIKVSKYLDEQISSFFYEDLINDLYKRIDPHPEYKKIRFICDFKDDKPKLNVCLYKGDNLDDAIIPNLYFSTAQLNILSLSIFLAKALNAKDDEGEAIESIFIDDPIQSMDSINILSTIDLFRSLVLNQGKQIILSTHDENFHNLLKKKMPPDLFKSKFLELETFGKLRKR